MPYVDNSDVQIHFRVMGEGEPLIMQHGFFSSIQDWFEFGYVEILSQTSQLIMVDARGHGSSDKPYDSKDYELEKFASDIAAVLDYLGIEKANYFGYSMGGWIGYGMVRYAPERLRKIIIGGAQPYGKTFSNARKILELGIDAWISEIQGWGAYSSEDLDRYRENNAQALLAALNDRPDISDILPYMNMPCLFYAGDGDNEHELIKGLKKEVRYGTFLSFPDLNHIDIFMNGGLVANHLVNFLAS